jgi:hypothetical protein
MARQSPSGLALDNKYDTVPGFEATRSGSTALKGFDLRAEEAAESSAGSWFLKLQKHKLRSGGPWHRGLGKPCTVTVWSKVGSERDP